MIETPQPQREKSRHLSPIDYLDALQVEYFVNMLKFYIYYAPNDRRYYKRVMGHKRYKIEHIADDNHIPCIFDDDDLYDEYKKKVFPEQGLPTVLLTPDEVDYYFCVGTDVKVNAEEKVLLGKIVSVNGERTIITVKIKGESEARPFPQRAITRVF